MNLDNALAYHRDGYFVIPVRPNKKPYIKWTQYQDEKPLLDEVQEWWAKWPDANIGLITGKNTDLVVIDVDDEDGIRVMKEMAPGLKPMTSSPHGFHFWFKYHPDLVNKARVLSGIDVRTDGGYIIAYPGQNDNGGVYKKYPEGRKYEQIPKALYSALKEVEARKEVDLVGLVEYQIANSVPSENATENHKTPQNTTERHKTP